MKKVVLFISFLFALLSHAEIVQKPSVERLVNDFANIINPDIETALEDSLSRYARRTSTQITIVTVNDLDGYDVADYAYRVGQSWGVGQKGKNNGVVILVKPKLSNNDKGRAFIAPGYGLEGVLPDVTCSHIVRDFMIPHFQTNDYSMGIAAGAIAVMKACEGEFEGSDTDDDTETIVAVLFFFIMIIIAIVVIFNEDKRGNNGHMTFGGGMSDAAFLSYILGSSRNSGWGSFSGGSGSFGGGFGGFGGGSFGGGGGGGSW